MLIKKTLAEFMGTFILVFMGSMGILSMGGANGPAEIIAISFAFGLALLAGIWALGHVSGAHFNPAVTLAMLLERRTTFSEAIGYWIGQFAGAGVASLVIMAVFTRAEVGTTITRYDDLSTAIVFEIVLTAIFVLVILAVTKTGGNAAAAGIALTLVGVHLAGITSSGASVNPARSFAPAAVSGEGLDQLWVYIVFPLVGAVIAWALYRLFPAEDAA